MQFNRLRLSGFKSFVDPTDLMIEPGMTGIVGPNGCGKSNLVEALRWVMGETSAKRMRGGEMDDVIFGGTSNRPARNIAEVALLLDNAAKRAPLAFNDEVEIEVVRRIDRGSGSGYRINGKEVRARDVQLLFADAATGSQSTALVSQGRIGAIINAKPVERRGLLEEAANIAGLHSRRHEAELRLKAAEANISRLDDVIVTLNAQFETLRKQAKQAGRYRRLSEQIRRAEAIVLHLLWIAAEAANRTAGTRLDAAEREVGERMRQAVSLGRQRDMAAEKLPPLRQTEAATTAEVQRLTLAQDGLEQEERRVHDSRLAAEQRLRQLDHDRGREAEIAADADAALTRLAEERQTLLDAQGEEAARQHEAAERVRDIAQDVTRLDGELARATEETAAIEARRVALARQQAEADERLARLAGRIADTERQRQALQAQSVPPDAIAAAEEKTALAADSVEQSRIAAEDAEQALRLAQGAEQSAREKVQATDAARTKLRAEAQALSDLLAAGSRKGETPALDALTVTPGYEAALAAALGDDLTASLDTAAPTHWGELPPPLDAPPALPDGAQSFADLVSGPPALARRLSQIGVVATPDEARAMQLRLATGQRIVARDGGLWRWDGFTVKPGAPTAAAQRLKQRNRLRELTPLVEAAERDGAAAREALETAREESVRLVEAERLGRQAMRDAMNALAAARDAQGRLAQQNAAAASKLAALDDALAQLAADREEAAERQAAAREALLELPDGITGRERVAQLRAQVAERRAEQLARQGDLDRLTREAAARQQRLAAIQLEERSWHGRVTGAAKQRATLEERHQALVEEIAALAGRPAEIAVQRETLADALTLATARRNSAADALAAAEAALAEAERTARAAEAALAEAREERVRCEAGRDQAREALAAIGRRIAERLDCPPGDVLAQADIPPDEAMPELADAETRLDRLTRERDAMGPVNLMAEDEAAELEARLGALNSEREDLIAAIARLRQGIAALNREGRERLVAAFAKVNEHFEKLFVRLFGGGHAHLALDEGSGDDPLEAGLEIMASPPGKKLQTLSLLSGGEQALTALALLFAVFLTNPAPICVLDEVDAPLDDANVDRFCRLVEEIAASTDTRFLIITHHRVTMARMDRLFGVTMAERGISQLVSVDLQGAERLRKTA